VIARLEAGGCIGRHPAVVGQLLVLLSGAATVTGDDGQPVEIVPGQAALWAAGESHETRSRTGMVAAIVEADGLAAFSEASGRAAEP